MLPQSTVRLIESFQLIPSIGRKTAQRISLQLLIDKKAVAQQLAESLIDAVKNTRLCKNCRNIADKEQCQLCMDDERDKETVCIVTSPLDLIALESTRVYNGTYFVLHGNLSPIQNITPDDIGLDILQSKVQNSCVKELIIAINLTTEGVATAHYIETLCRGLVKKTSRIAHGVPFGGELEFVDNNTLQHAINRRR